MNDEKQNIQEKTIRKVAEWGRVDRGIDEARKLLRNAINEEQCQAVGLVCRETIISLAQVVFNSTKHQPSDGIMIRSTDASRMLEAYISTELAGGPKEELRSYAKASLKLAVALQHHRTANLRDATICTEATTSIVNLISVIDNRSEAETHVLTNRPDRESAEKEYFLLLLVHALNHHPVVKMLNIKVKKYHFDVAKCSVLIEHDGVELSAEINKTDWWRPATRATVESVAEEIVKRTLAGLPEKGTIEVSLE